MVSPLIATAMWMVFAFVALAVMDGVAAAWRDVPTLVLGGLLLGLPVALAAVVLLAGPLYAFLVWRDRVTLGAALVGGAAVGSVALLVVGHVLENMALIGPGMGFLVGVGTAAAWWAIARPTRAASR